MNFRLRAAPQQPLVRILRPALTASAQAGSSGSSDSKRGLQRLYQPWHPRAFWCYRNVPEAWYPSQFYSRSLQKTRFFPAILNDRGEAEESDDATLVELFDRIQDPGGGRTELTGAYGILQFLTGDGYLTVTEQDGEEAWEYLSVMELKLDPNAGLDDPQRYRRLRAPGAKPEELTEAADSDFGPVGNKARVWRLWRRHPEYTNLSDSPMEAVVELYELLQRLTAAASSEAQSRAALRGFMLVANEVADQFGVVGGDDDPQSDPFMRAMGEAFEAGIQNPGSPAAASPIFIRAPASVQPSGGGPPVSMENLLKWIPPAVEKYHEGDMWAKTIERIGNGLDLPKEILTGMGGQNHWSGWLVDEQGYRQHVAPVTQGFCDDLASAYLRPAAREAEFEDWERVTVGYDPAEAINHPDQTTVAKDAHEAFVIKDKTYRDVAGFTDDDAPDDAEIERRIDIAIKRRALIPPDIADQPVQQGETSPANGGTGSDTVEQPPPASPANQNGGSPPAVAASALMTAKIIGAAELQVERARELAGNKLIRRSQSCGDCKERIREVATSMVAAALGGESVRAIIDGHTTEAALVSGAGVALAHKLREWGLQGEYPEHLGRLVEQHAQRTLYELKPPPLPPGFAAAVLKAVR